MTFWSGDLELLLVFAKVVSVQHWDREAGCQRKESANDEVKYPVKPSLSKMSSSGIIRKVANKGLWLLLWLLGMPVKKS